MSSERPGAALARALAIVSLCLLPFGLEYGYSVLVIPIQSILTPSSPYALDDSHAVWALAGSLLMAGAALYTGAGAIRRSPKLFLLGTGVGSAIGLALQGVAMALAEHRRGTAIALYYLGQVLFFGPGCGVSFLIALIASIAWMTRLFPSRPGLGSGAVGPCLAVETAVLIWIFYGFNDFGRNDLCKECGEGRVDLFFFVAAAVVGLSQFAAASLWRLPAPLAVAAAPETESGTSTTAAPDKESGTSKTSLSFGDVARSRTFWSFFMVYLVSLLPGFGLKLMSAPIVYFTYGFSDAASAAFTYVYLLAYGAGRFLTPVLSQDRFDRACFIYQSYSVVSALVLLVSPATVNGLPSGRWPAPLPFCILVAAQGFFLGGFKGLMPCWLKGLWRWMDADPEFAHYDSAPAFNFAFSMTNLALCIAAAVGPVTAWTAYVGSPDVSQSDLDSGRATGHDYELWYYGAGGMQLLAAVALVVPGAVPRFEPPADLA